MVTGSGQCRTLPGSFRDTYFQFCNFRSHDSISHQLGLTRLGPDTVVVFISGADDIKRFVARQPGPFSVVVDQSSDAYKRYAIEC